MKSPVDCKSLSDREVLSRLKQAAAQERRSLIHLLCYLAETGRRELYAKESYPSLICLLHRGIALFRRRSVPTDSRGASSRQIPGNLFFAGRWCAFFRCEEKD